MDKLLSIIIPVYCTEEYFHRCIESVLKQTYKNVEIIVVNDGSKGNISHVMKEYIQKDNRIIYIDNKCNSGLFKARLIGASHASGDYIAFLDSDDYVSIDFYRALMEKTEEEYDIIAGATVLERKGRHSQYILHENSLSTIGIFNEKVRESFYEQEGYCYAWHTIWNKIYRKKLWDICVPYYNILSKKHIVMTEDIAFSSVLFYFAKSFIKLENVEIYYTQNPESSVNSNKNSDKLIKSMQDMIFVFDFVEDFLKSVSADEIIKNHMRIWRARYARIWSSVIPNDYSINANTCLKLLVKLKGGEETGKIEKSSIKDHFFDLLESKWYDDFEKIKIDINNTDIEVVSFDIFDTLILRNVLYPDDVFLIMQQDVEKISDFFKVNKFIDIRKMSEENARCKLQFNSPEYDDVTLEDIYFEFRIMTGLNSELVDKIKLLEETTEIYLSCPRKNGIYLLNYAKAIGKRIILTSDMYLGRECIEKILNKNKIAGYEKLFLSSEDKIAKFSGKLYDYVLRYLDIKPTAIMHIGDNYEKDIQMANSKGIKTGFFPKTIDRFMNGMKKHSTNNCSLIGCLVGNDLTTWDKIYSALGYRCMISLVCNKYFDNSYRNWNVGTSFNSDPYFMGYYAVGMHLIGICKWLKNIKNMHQSSKVIFLGRDGYFPKKAYDILWDKEDTEYVPCSRKAILPWIIKNAGGLYNLPINYREYTREDILNMLKFCSKENYDMPLNSILNIKFNSKTEYFNFIKWFKDNVFDERKLYIEQEIVRKYYQKYIKKDDIVFDMGYSGRIPKALQECLEYHVKFAYIYHDNKEYYNKTKEIDIECMYNYTPIYSGLIREVFLSELNNSCVGFYENEKDDIIPKIKNDIIRYVNRFSYEQILLGAMDFIKDYHNVFYKYYDVCDFMPTYASMPFEGLIHKSSVDDRRVMIAIDADDTVYGNNSNINLADFWIMQNNHEIDISATKLSSSYEWFIFPFELVPKDSKIIIYGAGKVGNDYKLQINKTGYCHIVDIVDTNYKNKKGCCSPDRLMKKDFDYIVCAVGTNDLFNEIKKIILTLDGELLKKVIYVERKNRVEL